MIMVPMIPLKTFKDSPNKSSPKKSSFHLVSSHPQSPQHSSKRKLAYKILSSTNNQSSPAKEMKMACLKTKQKHLPTIPLSKLDLDRNGGIIMQSSSPKVADNTTISKHLKKQSPEKSRILGKKQAARNKSKTGDQRKKLLQRAKDTVLKRKLRNTRSSVLRKEDSESDNEITFKNDSVLKTYRPGTSRVKKIAGRRIVQRHAVRASKTALRKKSSSVSSRLRSASSLQNSLPAELTESTMATRSHSDYQNEPKRGEKVAMVAKKQAAASPKPPNRLSLSSTWLNKSRTQWKEKSPSPGGKNILLRQVKEGSVESVTSNSSTSTLKRKGLRSPTWNQKKSNMDSGPSTPNSIASSSGFLESLPSPTISSLQSQGGLVTVPTYHPSPEQFTDPISYIDSIRTDAERYGMCRIVPPEDWKPECCIHDDLKFATQNQHIHRLQDRWGKNAFEMECIRKHLEGQTIKLDQIPIVGGMELDLPALREVIEGFGGIQVVINRNLWVKVAENLKIPKTMHERFTRLYDIYCKYLLSYDTLSEEERDKLSLNVAKKKKEAPDVIVKGRTRQLGEFFKMSRNLESIWLNNDPKPEEVEELYWELVEDGKHHISVQVADIDTRECGSGFPTRRDEMSHSSPYSRHGWNFNQMQHNNGSILKNIGPVSGVSSPTLHIGMLFSTSCWVCDQHYLPFINYKHTGAETIWYVIPKSEENRFYEAASESASTLIDSDSVWLQEDTLMMSPKSLIEKNVSVGRVVQEQGQFIVVFPQAYTAAISCGYSIAESLRFATADWIPLGCQAAKMCQESNQPELFSMERLLIKLARNDKVTTDVLKLVYPELESIIEEEMSLRKQLKEAGLISAERISSLDLPNKHTYKSQLEMTRCEITGKICYLSMVVNTNEDAIYSLEQAVPHVQRKRNLKACNFLYRFSELELKDILNKVRLKLSGSTPPKKKIGRTK